MRHRPSSSQHGGGARPLHTRERTGADSTLDGEIESAAALAFQRRSWIVERVAWVVMALLCVAGLLGLFGSGPFSRSHLSAPDLEVRYDGVVRAGAPQTLELRVMPVRGAARIALATAYLDGVRLDGVWPTPEHVAASSQWTTFSFASSDGTPIHVAFTLVPDRAGVLDGKLRRESDPELAFRQIVYP